VTDHPALNELYKLIKSRHLGETVDGTNARLHQFNDWVDRWTEEVQVSQSVIKNKLTSEDEDFIKYYLSYKMGEELMINCVDAENEKRCIKTRIRAFKVR
jgi:hypothetical protein